MKRELIALSIAIMVFLFSGCSTSGGGSSRTANLDTVTETKQYEDRVYITPYGEKYHRRASCAGKNATPTERETAEFYFDPCKKCAGG